MIKFQVEDGGGWITLNRPHALNSLNTDMVRDMSLHLKQWATDPLVAYVVIRGEGRAFCSGADLMGVAKSGSLDFEDFSTFVTAEFKNIVDIHKFKKPYISILDGIVMGGGMGLSMHGTYAILTEKSLLCMPETAIGFFPDAGASWFFNRTPGKIGLYLGLTSNRIGPQDGLYAGLGTHFVYSSQLEALLSDIRKDGGNNIPAILEKHHQQPEGEAPLKKAQSVIDRCFDQPSIEKIFDALAHDDTVFAAETLARLKAMSPLSLRITFDHLQATRQSSIDEAMAADLALALSWHGVPEYWAEWREGIRAALVDKDQKPHWLSAPIEY